jgi:hypothetical protein
MPATDSNGGINAPLSKEHVIVANVRGDRRLLFKVWFGSQGDLYVALPYFTPANAILGRYPLPGNGQSTTQVDMRVEGYVTSRTIKYSHHVSGIAQFSGASNEKVRSEVRTQSVPLADAEGHLFTVHVKGIAKFEPATRQRDQARLDP